MSAVLFIPPHRYRQAAVGAVLLALIPTAQAWAQTDDIEEVSSPVVQLIPGEGSMKLNAALGRLGRDPRDVSALIDAGKAALDMGDGDAAVGFYQRADTLSPGNPRVKAGLAGAYVRNGDPFTAIPLFAAAEAAGPIEPALLSERGFAYDLVGDNETAQGYYRTVLAAGPNDETTRRLGLSQAIYGDRRGMETTLAPLLQRQDKAAWRARAFSFAILGLADEAESIARSVMPAELAAAITPYLRYMPRLTAAQQAAAASSGHFPRAAEIGLDDPRVAQYSKPRKTLAAVDRALVPAGKPLGRDAKPRNTSRTSSSQTVAVAPAPVRLAVPPVPAPAREAIKAPVQLTLNTAVLVPAQPSQAQPEAIKTVPPAPLVVPLSAGATSQGPGFAALEPAAANPSEPKPNLAGFDLSKAVPAPVVIQTPTAAKPAAVVPTPRLPNLADVFADLGTPSREAVPAAGAVDMRRIARSSAALDPKELPVCKPGVVGKAAANCKAATPPPPSHPSRIWVQLATGRDKRALAFDWRRMVRDEPERLRGRKGFTSAWGQTNRLLTGPFETEAAASSYVAQLRRAGMGGSFVWTSPAGQVVDALVGK